MPKRSPNPPSAKTFARKFYRFTFPDLSHTAINNWRLQGHDYFRIMAAIEHRTLKGFKRYHTVSKDELKALLCENR